MPADAIARLNADWDQLCASSSHAARVAGWLAEAGVPAPATAPVGLADLLADLKRRDRQGGRSHSDAWLAAILRHVADPGAAGQLAARVVVQAMLDSAHRTARSLRQDGLSFAETSTITVSALYEVVARYRLERRPQRIAANLALDTLRVAVREVRRESLERHVAIEDVPVGRLAADVMGPAELAALAELAEAAVVAGLADPATRPEQLAGPRAEVIELLLWAQARQLLDGQQLAAVTGHYREGAPPDKEAARSAGVSVPVWKKRRSRAVSQLRRTVPQWQAAGAA
jgi:DNA-directed RNA polymerase specialized sigma24 family protein